jgi:hypothetical protein
LFVNIGLWNRPLLGSLPTPSAPWAVPTALNEVVI